MTNQAFGTASLVFIDAGVEAAQLLLSGLQPGVQAYALDANQDGIWQISQIIKNNQSVIETSKLSISIVGHAVPGSIRLGNSVLNLNTLNYYTQQLKTWFPSSCLSKESRGEVSFYACNLAAGDAGEEFITKLQQIVGADIYASSTKVGNAALGGNWELDFKAESKIKSLEGYKTTTLFSLEALLAYPVVLMADTDGDGVDDTDDLDDDNDGILDTQEGLDRGSEAFGAGWYQDGPPKNGEEVTFDSTLFSAVTDYDAGPGVTESKTFIGGTNGITVYEVTGANAASMPAAIAAGDYIESTITAASGSFISEFQTNRLSGGSQGTFSLATFQRAPR